MITLCLSLALAQTTDGSGFDAHGFRLAAHDGDLRDPLVGWRPGAMEQHAWFAAGVLEYANQPLVFRPDETTVVQVDHQVVVNSSFGYAPHERLRLDLAVPVFAYSEGIDGSLGAGLGDLRLTGTVVLVAPDGRRPGIGVFGNADLPTGDHTRFRGQKAVAGGVGFAITQELDKVTLTGSRNGERILLQCFCAKWSIQIC